MIYFYIVLIVLVIVAWFVIKKNPNKYKNPMLIDIAFLIGIFLLLGFILSGCNLLNSYLFKNYISTIKNMINLMMLFFIIIISGYAVVGFWGKKYSLRIDNFNIGGINIFFDKSNEIFIKTVGTFIASKRTLFKFDKRRDNISEVLNAYYETYKYIKDNLELLDTEKDKKIYELSTEALQKLNNFLSKHQNDYRRWYARIIEDDEIILLNHEPIIVHTTTIEDVQKNYYRYTELIGDIEKINEYFSQDTVKTMFHIEYFYWSGKLDA